jgi:hypothetical protein
VRRHAVDPISLVAGLTFGFLALFFLFGDHTANDLAWPWAAVIPLMAFGAAAVLVGLRRALASDGSHDRPPDRVDEAETDAAPPVPPTAP